MINKQTNLDRPSVTVRVPSVVLRLEDLAFLRSLGQPQGVRCVVGYRVKDRLRFLDLIARAHVPRSPEFVEKVEKNMSKLLLDLDNAVRTKDWDAISHIGYSLKTEALRLAPIEDDVLTQKGRDLLKFGEVQIKVRKVGCVK